MARIVNSGSSGTNSDIEAVAERARVAAKAGPEDLTAGVLPFAMSATSSKRRWRDQLRASRSSRSSREAGARAVGPGDPSAHLATVREATFELLRARGMTTIFGNPGSTELPMLSSFPGDLSYVLGLQELVVVGMADGYAHASGRPTLVSLHTAPGVGNALGGIVNAQANKSPLVITAGQQVRPHILIEATLTHRGAVIAPQPYVKWSVEDGYGKQHLETVELHIEPDSIGGQGRVEDITPVAPR